MARALVYTAVTLLLGTLLVFTIRYSCATSNAAVCQNNFHSIPPNDFLLGSIVKIRTTPELAIPRKHLPKNVRSLPSGPILQAYQSMGISTDDEYQAAYNVVKAGANVITWAFIRMLVDDNGNPYISDDCNGNFTTIARLAKQLQEDKLDVVHFVSNGGWNILHPDDRFSGATWYDLWNTWNENIYLETGFSFDGIDWDPEGEDDPQGVRNYFTLAELDLIGEFSQLAKENGYLVSIVPAQSYLDGANDEFSQYVNFTQYWKPDFPYHGKNVYAYWIAKYDAYIDLVLIQVYEGWARAGYEVSLSKNTEDVAKYFRQFVRNYTSGYEVKFSQEPDCGLNDQIIKIAPAKLIITVANAWAAPIQPPTWENFKFPLFFPEWFLPMWDPKEFRGFGLWFAPFEGSPVQKYDQRTKSYENYPLYIISEFNQFVKVRV